MNLFTAILDGAVAFVRRNPLFCLLILMLALFAPSVLGGIAMFRSEEHTSDSSHAT